MPAQTLTDRYVATALRALPEQQRPDIERELRGSIADALDARLNAGESRAEAERAVLIELGDPDALAASYLDRPRVLISAATYPHWRRLLRLLLMIVLPVVVIIDVVTSLLSGEGVGEVIAGIVMTILFVGIQLCFWVTAVFWLLDRTKSLPAYRWDPSRLPAAVDTADPNARPEAVASAVWSALLIGLVVWQQFSSTFVTDGRAVPVLDPSHWVLWWPLVLALLGLEAVIAVSVMTRGRWSVPLLVVHVVGQVALTAIGLYLLLTRQFFNPDFIALLHWNNSLFGGFDLGWADSTGPERTLTIGGVLALVIALGFELWNSAARHRRALRSR